MFDGYRACREVVRATICIARDEKRVVRGQGGDGGVVEGEEDDEETVGG